MGAQLGLDQATRRRREHALLVAPIDSLVERDVGAVAPRVLGRNEPDVRRDLERGIEEDEPLDAIRRGCGDLECDPPAERVAEPGAATGRCRFEHVLDVLLQMPGWLPAGVTVSAQVERDHVPVAGETSGELREVQAVARDAVQADERRQALVPPSVAGEAHSAVTASGAEATSVLRSLSLFTRLQTTMPSLSIRNVPRTGAPLLSSKTPYAFAASPWGQKSDASV